MNQVEGVLGAEQGKRGKGKGLRKGGLGQAEGHVQRPWGEAATVAAAEEGCWGPDRQGALWALERCWTGTGFTERVPQKVMLQCAKNGL